MTVKWESKKKSWKKKNSDTGLATYWLFPGSAQGAMLEKRIVKWSQPNSKLWVLNSKPNWVLVTTTKVQILFQTDTAESSQLISLGFLWISDSTWIWETSLEAIISPSLQPCSSVFTFTPHPDTSVFLVHILNNQPQSMGFIWLRRGFTPKWASFPMLLQWRYLWS